MQTTNLELNNKFNQLSEVFNTSQAAQNEHFIDAVAFVTSSFIKSGFPTNDYHIKGIKDVCLWVGYCFPGVEKDVYLIYSLVISYLSVVDDACDRQVDREGIFRSELSNHIHFLNHDEFLVNNNPSLVLASQVKQLVQESFSEAKATRILNTCAEFFKSSKCIAEMWVSNIEPSLERYEELRQIDSMASILIELSLIYSSSSPNAAPLSWLASEQTTRAYVFATKCCSIMNDVASLGKDLEDNISNNYVLLLGKEINLDNSSSSNHCLEMVMDSYDELASLPTDLVVRDAMMRVVKGYVNWCLITPRFHHENHIILALCKQSKQNSRLTSHLNDVATYLDAMMQPTLQPEPPITEKPRFNEVFKNKSSMELRVYYYKELILNQSLNLIPFLLCFLLNGGCISMLTSFLIMQVATVMWTLSLHTLIHAQCSNSFISDISDLSLGLGYFGIFTPSIAKYGHQTHHSYTETDADFDYYFFKTEGTLKLLLKSTFFPEIYIRRFYQEKKDTGNTTSILLSKLCLMVTLYTVFGNSYLLMLLSARFSCSYLFASFTTLVHSIDMIEFLNKFEGMVGWKWCSLDSVLESLFTYNIHVVKYHSYHHDYPWICPSAYCPTLTNLHPIKSVNY